MVPEELRYTEEHEWVAPTGTDTVRMGITDFAQKELGDVVYLQLPDVGQAVTAGDPLGEVESVKAVAEVYAPFGGEVVARNDAVEESPELLNSDPYGEGWLLEIRVDEQDVLEALLTAEDYRRLIGQAG